MKKSVFLIFIASLFFTAASATGQNLRVITYNLHNGVGLDKVRDHARLANIISSAQPDFVGVQEVDSLTRRSGQRYLLGELAELTGMVPVYAPAIDYDGGKYGIGILAKSEPDSVVRIPLPGREEKRVLVVTYYNNVVFANTHLSLTPEDALASAGIIHDVLGNEKRPVILTGDLNSLPDSPAIKALMADFTIVSPEGIPTFPANAPTERIDYIMVSRDKNCRVTQSDVINDPVASDHRPVIAEVMITE